jgi:hypothetical protein
LVFLFFCFLNKLLKCYAHSRSRSAAAQAQSPARPSTRDGWMLGRVVVGGEAAGTTQPRYFHEGDRRFKWGGGTHVHGGIEEVAVKSFNVKAMAEVKRAEEVGGMRFSNIPIL